MGVGYFGSWVGTVFSGFGVGFVCRHAVWLWLTLLCWWFDMSGWFGGFGLCSCLLVWLLQLCALCMY